MNSQYNSRDTAKDRMNNLVEATQTINPITGKEYGVVDPCYSIDVAVKDDIPGFYLGEHRDRLNIRDPLKAKLLGMELDKLSTRYFNRSVLDRELENMLLEESQKKNFSLDYINLYR